MCIHQEGDKTAAKKKKRNDVDFLPGECTKPYSEVPYGYEAFLCLSEADKRGLAPQDIVLLSYSLKIRVLRRHR